MGAKKIKQAAFYSTGDVAKIVGKCTETIRREIKKGRLRTLVFNGNYAIPVEAFEEWKAKYFTKPE